MSTRNTLRIGQDWLALILVGAIAAPLAFVATAGADDHEALEKEMETINSHYKTLRRDARKGEYAPDTAGKFPEMLHAAITAMHLKPPMIAKVPADKQAQFLVDYKKEMKKMIVHIIDMEIAFDEGRKDDLAKMIDDLNTIKGDGHEKFVPEE
jgi:hypothetical protein